MRPAIILVPVLLLAFSGYGQDSIRTRNDKPGTPQSLRTPDHAPRNRVHIINTNTDPRQTINHGATESNKVNNAKDQTIKVDPNMNNGSTVIPQGPVMNNQVSRNNTPSNAKTDTINATRSQKRP